jgi:hypothetical protein
MVLGCHRVAPALRLAGVERKQVGSGCQRDLVAEVVGISLLRYRHYPHSREPSATTVCFALDLETCSVCQQETLRCAFAERLWPTRSWHEEPLGADVAVSNPARDRAGRAAHGPVRVDTEENMFYNAYPFK